VYSLLNSWSDEDIEAHFSRIKAFYRDRRDTMLKAVEKYFTGDLMIYDVAAEV
jgi:DNA-binding transcriptional MocR family regulator